MRNLNCARLGGIRLRGRHISPQSHTAGTAICPPAPDKMARQVYLPLSLQCNFLGAPGLADRRRTRAICRTMVLVARTGLACEPANGHRARSGGLRHRYCQPVQPRRTFRKDLRSKSSRHTRCNSPSAALGVGVLGIRSPLGQGRPCACRPVWGDRLLCCSWRSCSGAASAQTGERRMETAFGRHGSVTVCSASEREGSLVVFTRMAFNVRSVGLDRFRSSASTRPRRVAASTALTSVRLCASQFWSR